VWDETIVLPESEIGQLSIFARRSGDMWILAVMRAGPARTIQVPLLFLGDGIYEASLVSDSKDQSDAVVLEDRKVERSDTLTIVLADGGGFVGRFSKASQ
jgi:alpha-glucosidase